MPAVCGAMATLAVAPSMSAPPPLGRHRRRPRPLRHHGRRKRDGSASGRRPSAKPPWQGRQPSHSVARRWPRRHAARAHGPAADRIGGGVSPQGSVTTPLFQRPSGGGRRPPLGQHTWGARRTQSPEAPDGGAQGQAVAGGLCRTGARGPVLLLQREKKGRRGGANGA